MKFFENQRFSPEKCPWVTIKEKFIPSGCWSAMTGVSTHMIEATVTSKINLV